MVNGGGSENEARRRRILDAAADLIARYGYDKTAVGDIAAAAGVSKGAIYLHFGSKDELFEALLFREMWRYGDAWLVAVEADPRGGTLGGAYKNGIAALHGSPFMAAIFARDPHTLGSYLHKPGSIFRSTEASAMRADFVRAMQEAGVVRADVDPAVLAHIMEMLSFGFISIADYKDPARIPPFEAIFETIAVMMDRAFTPADGADSEAGKAVFRRIMVAAREQFGQPPAKPQAMARRP